MNITYCKFDIDTASVKLRFSDGTEICIYTLGVDDELCSLKIFFCYRPEIKSL